MDEPITRREQYYAGIAEALRNGGGGGGGILIVHLDDSGHADYTNGEIWEAIQAGKNVWLAFPYNDAEAYAHIFSAMVLEMNGEMRYSFQAQFIQMLIYALTVASNSDERADGTTWAPTSYSLTLYSD